MSETRQYSIEELSRFVASANISKLERETEVSRHNLLRVKRMDKTIPFNVLEKLSEYYGAE